MKHCFQVKYPNCRSNPFMANSLHINTVMTIGYIISTQIWTRHQTYIYEQGYKYFYQVQALNLDSTRSAQV